MLARLILICGLSLFLSQPTLAGPIYTPRDSGTEAPGGPRAPIGVPTPSNFGRTQEGGMGYTDAYGNTISGEIPETAPKKRLPQGAYGRYGKPDPDNRPLPDPAKGPSKPAWGFR
ncbi:MAG: translation initiation factor IF-2 [Desulfovibrionaceae bacterium]|nr:translation initiation factor IF-2 [Desulfovibrionaceae bacterium]